MIFPQFLEMKIPGKVIISWSSLRHFLLVFRGVLRTQLKIFYGAFLEK